MYIAGLKRDVSEGWHRVVSDRAMNHDVGNLLNDIVFGRTYDEDDPTWRDIQRAREDGIKMLGVASGLQFLPWLGWLQAKVTFCKRGCVRLASDTGLYLQHRIHETF